MLVWVQAPVLVWVQASALVWVQALAPVWVQASAPAWVQEPELGRVLVQVLVRLAWGMYYRHKPLVLLC